jgi:hypothetical protein
MLNLSTVAFLALLAMPDEEPLRPHELEEVRDQARRSHLVVEATVVDPLVNLDRPELRRPTTRRGAHGEALQRVSLPGEHVVGALTRVRIESILKPDGRASVGDVIEIVAAERHPYPWGVAGERHVLLLETPFRLNGQDDLTGWRTLEGTTVRDPITLEDLPFVTARAYGRVDGPSMVSRAARLPKIVKPENADAIQVLRQQVALTNDNIPPTVTLRAPVQAAQFVRGIASLDAEASDNVGIRDVEWLVEPQGLPPDIPIDAARPVAPPVTSAPYVADWTTDQLADGHYVLWTKATDFAGNVGLGRRDITVDNTPPRAIIRAQPELIWGCSGQMMPIAVTVHLLTDALDPAPTIRLLSVTASQPLAPGDVTGGSPGDDRALAVRAACMGLQRVYTIHYEARDRAGNTTQASATVAVLRESPPPPPEPEP